MAFNPLKLFSRQQNAPAPVPGETVIPDGNAAEGANERGSATFNDVQTFRPEVDDEVVVSMLNNKNPELTRYDGLAEDGKFGPETLSIDQATPKLGDAVASSRSGLEAAPVVDHPVFSVDEANEAVVGGGLGPEVLSLDKSSPKLAEAVASLHDGPGSDVDANAKSTPFLFESAAIAPEPAAEGILPYVEQQPYHGGGEAMQDVFVTEAVAPNPQSNVLDPGYVLGDAFTGSDEELRDLVSRLQQRGLIDTSTGEIVWADEATSNFTGSDEELGALVAWLRGNNLIDTSTGEIVWVRQPSEASNWFVPDMDSDQSGMAREVNQVSVGGFGGGVDDDRMATGNQPQSLYFEDSVRTAREATDAGGGAGVLSGHSGGWNVAGDWDGDANDTIGAATLLPADHPDMASGLSLNFEEIKVTVVDMPDLDIDGDAGDADIELPD